MSDVNILYIIIAILSGYILFGKRKLSIPFDNYNCKDIEQYHMDNLNKLKADIYPDMNISERYCISTTCPMLKNCKRNRQAGSGIDSYTDYSERIAIGSKGYECEMFVYKIVI